MTTGAAIRTGTAPSTIERAYQLARSGAARDTSALKQMLKREGCRAVDALLSPRSIRGHLDAICAATYQGVEPVL